MMPDPNFQDAESRKRFELDVDGQTVFADYTREPGTLVIHYVYAPPALRGTGAAGRLMNAIAARAREEDRKVLAICHYAHAWLRKRGHRDLLVR